jgi:Spy/CpxP family protein refolding chaperone
MKGIPAANPISFQQPTSPWSNKMNIKNLHRLLTLSSIIAIFTSASVMAELSVGGVEAREGGTGFHKWMERMVEDSERRHESYGDVILRHADELRLTDEQMGKIYRIHQANQHRIKGISQKVNDATAWAHEIFLDPSKDEAAIRQAAKAHSAAFDELLDTALRTRKDINAVLNTDQLAKLPAMKSVPK